MQVTLVLFLDVMGRPGVQVQGQEAPRLPYLYGEEPSGLPGGYRREGYQFGILDEGFLGGEVPLACWSLRLLHIKSYVGDLGAVPDPTAIQDSFTSPFVAYEWLVNEPCENWLETAFLLASSSILFL